MASIIDSPKYSHVFHRTGIETEYPTERYIQTSKTKTNEPSQLLMKLNVISIVFLSRGHFAQFLKGSFCTISQEVILHNFSRGHCVSFPECELPHNLPTHSDRRHGGIGRFRHYSISALYPVISIPGCICNAYTCETEARSVRLECCKE